MAVKAPPTPSPGCVQAVDGVNGKIAGFGGSAANHSYDGTEGAISVPLGCEFGAQIDALSGSFDGHFLGGAAGHLFWRNPAQGLIGAYGDYIRWDQFGGVRTGHVGGEGELYNGQWTLQGVAGAEFGNSATNVTTSTSIVGLLGTTASSAQSFNIKTRPFDQVNLKYYLVDNWSAYVGQRYLGGKDWLALGTEVGLPIGHGIMTTAFVEGRIGEGKTDGIWGGLRAYFGTKDKSLMARQRQDDPNNWSADSLLTIAGSQTTSGPTSSQFCTNAGTPPVC